MDSDTSEELTSTEDFLYNVEELNKGIKTGQITPQNLIIGSLDVENLYGSMDTELAASIIRQTVIESEVIHQNIDYRWALIYLAHTLRPIDIGEQKLQRVGRK